MIITAKCNLCGNEECFELTSEETEKLLDYWIEPRIGYVQDLFPRVPAWIRSGGIQREFCICPKCSGEEV